MIVDVAIVAAVSALFSVGASLLVSWWLRSRSFRRSCPDTLPDGAYVSAVLGMRCKHSLTCRVRCAPGCPMFVDREERAR